MRTMSADTTAVYRAVVIITCHANPDSNWDPAREDLVVEKRYGPFIDKRQASAAVTKAKRDADWWLHDGERTVEAWIEVAYLDWELVG
jgi:hypothetical protein